LPTYNGEYYSGYGQPSANVIAGMAAADKTATATKTATPTAPTPAPAVAPSGGSAPAPTKAPTATSGVDYNFANDPSKYVSANGVTYASADVARQQGVSDFLAGSAPKPPTTVPPKTVYTADPAATDLANKQADLQTATNAMTGQQQAVASTAEPTAKPATVEDLEKITAGSDKASIGLRAVQDKQDVAYENFQNQIKQFQNGTFPLTPDQQAVINATQAQLDQLRRAQELTNKNYEAGIVLAGIAAGRNRYAPEIELGNIQNAVSAGLQKVADLDIKAALAIADLRQGFQTQNFDLINSAYTAASNYFTQKTNTIFQMAENVRAETQLALNLHQQKVEEEKTARENQKANVQMAESSGVKTRFANKGGEFFNTGTGYAYSTPQEFFKDAGVNSFEEAYTKGLVGDVTRTSDLTFSIQDVGGQTVRFGFDKAGNVVSRVNLGTTSSSSKKLTSSKDIPTDTNIRDWIYANKVANPNLAYYDLWGQLVDDLKAQGLNPSNYDKIFWEILHPEGLAGYKKYVQ
jgi:hypothetical protein